MDLKQAWLHNLKIHYIWTLFSSVLFLAPIITLYYKFYWFDIQNILILTSVFTLASTLLEIPTSTIWDTIWRVKVMKMSVIFSLISFVIIFLFPNIYSFYIAWFFAALWDALWSGTWHAKLQDDLEASGMQNEFWKVIWKLIALQNIWKLFTPVVIYFVLKHFTNWYQILAWLDVVAWLIAVIFVFKFIEFWEIKKTENKKDFISLQVTTFKSGFKFLFSHKSLLILILLMILWNDLWYLARVLLPSLVENWVQDFLSSYVILFSVWAWILWNLIPKKLWDKFSWEKLFVVLMFFNALLHFWAYYFVDNNLILTIFFTFISFIIGIYWPTWNHLVMSFTNIAEKATVRSMFLMIIWIFEALMLFILSFASLSTWLLILAILIFIWFIVWSLYFLKK